MGDRDEARVILETERLVVRRWCDADAEPLARINADPAVMRHLGGPMSRADSDALLGRLRDQMEHSAYGRWAVEHRETGDLVGFLGLGEHPVAPEGPEIGWRFASAWWRQGLATEAAVAVRDLAFDELGVERIVSVTVPANAASLGVMRRIGLTPFALREVSVPENPRLPVVVYSLARGDRLPAP